MAKLIGLIVGTAMVTVLCIATVKGNAVHHQTNLLANQDIEPSLGGGGGHHGCRCIPKTPKA
jgi:hypothetical protein